MEHDDWAVESAYLPTEQEEHADTPVDEYLPMGQEEHDVAPVDAPNFPAAQDEQESA